MRFPRLVAPVAALILLSACGGGGGDDVSASGSGDSETATTPTTAASDAPKFIDDFERVCTTQVGFKDVTGFEAGPGVHPVVLFTDHRGEGFVAAAQELPAGWKVEQDANFEDNSDLKKAELVACVDRVKEIPTGVVCELEDDGEQVKLELVDADYDVKVYAATTGTLAHEQKIEARDSECPVFAAYKKGDTTFVNEPTDDQLINALKPVVAPA